MDFLSWVQVLTIYALGAILVGLSLVIVLGNIVKGGKKQGVLTGIGHGLGIYFYTALVVSGLSVALPAAPKLELYVSFVEVALLIWLGFCFLRSNLEDTAEQ
jgi:threonine/homoserine/homoserine lactone efflux protein